MGNPAYNQAGCACGYPQLSSTHTDACPMAPEPITFTTTLNAAAIMERMSASMMDLSHIMVGYGKAAEEHARLMLELKDVLREHEAQERLQSDPVIELSEDQPPVV